ncbi:hypothetical protein [Nocardia sp. NBC_01388]|uniref:hypothetical protein n=1 Tax=Nocardia sp. NBC_01388 TaxID=2903596 RepID=UPI002F90C297
MAESRPRDEGAPEDVRAKTLALLGVHPRHVRLLTAVHEAGHAVVADSVGAHVDSVTVLSDGHLTDPRGGNDHAQVEFPGAASADEVFAEYLTVLTAGFQSQYMWLTRSRGVTYTDQVQTGLSWLAAGDIHPANALRERCGRQDVEFVHAQAIAGMILRTRWSTLLRLAYHLNRTGYASQKDLQGYLMVNPQVRTKCLAYFRAWKDQVEDGTFREHPVYAKATAARAVRDAGGPHDPDTKEALL